MLKNQFKRDAAYDAVIYARMSSEMQNPRSPDQQIETIQWTITRLGLPWNIVSDYRDDGKSGRLTKKRPGLQRMLHDLRSGQVVAQIVLVDTYERLSRADDDRVRAMLKKSGVMVLTADSDFSDPTSVQGRALAAFESLRASEEGRIKAHNVLRGKKDSVRLGHWPGSRAPFGFRLRNVMTTRGGIEEIDYRVLEPDDKLREIVIRIFRLAAEQTWGGDRIAKSLNDDPAIPEGLKPFLGTTIRYMLSNELYYGEFVWGRTCTGIVDDAHIRQPLPEDEWERNPDFCEGIVSRQLWDRAQQILKQRRRGKRVTNNDARAAEIPGLRAPSVALRYPLSGLVVCSACGRSMFPASGKEYTTKAGKVHRYVSYACPVVNSGACHNRRRVPEEWLREQVVKLIRSRLFLDSAGLT